MHAVETLLNEFYQTTTSNARKRVIEAELIAFKSQPHAWQLCLRVASSCESNQFLWFFCTSTLEHTITRRWAQLSESNRQLLKETLWQTYLGLSVHHPKRQIDTFAQLIALIGKRQFPNDDAQYMMHCLELVKTKFVLGINLLRITSEVSDFY